MCPHQRGTLVQRCGVHRIMRIVIALVLLAPVISCQSSGGERTFRWPWKKEKPGGLGTVPEAPGANPDPFLPPPAAKGDDLSADVPAAQPVVQLRRPTHNPISLVSATRDLEPEDAEASMEAILRPLAARRDYKYIVLHHSHSETGDLEKIDQKHREVLGWEGCGYHFVIGNGSDSADGQIEVSQRWRLQKHGAHMSTQAPSAYNLHGIGICFVGNFESQPPTPRQLESARELVRYLMQIYDIPAYRVLTHSEVTGDGEHGGRCPGPLFRIDDILQGR